MNPNKRNQPTTKYERHKKCLINQEKRIQEKMKNKNRKKEEN